MDAQKHSSPRSSSPKAKPRKATSTKSIRKPIICRTRKPDVYFHEDPPAQSDGQSGQEGQGGRHYLINGVLRVTHPDDTRLGGAAPMTEEQTVEFYEDLVRMGGEELEEKWRGYWVGSCSEVDRVFGGG